MRKGQGDGDWEPSALELGAKLRKVQRKNTALVAEVKQLKEQLTKREEACSRFVWSGAVQKNVSRESESSAE